VQADTSLRTEQLFLAPPAGAAATSTKEALMQWTTPQACDFRFGFEITMYVAAR
jgi:pyrroloquinoline quinone biosynthesis protein A